MPKKTVFTLILSTVLISFVIVLLNFRFFYFAGGDQSLYIDPKIFFDFISSFWDENINYVLGGVTMSTHLLIPFVFFFKFFSFLPVRAVEYLYFTAVFASIYLVSFYYFYKYLFKNITASFFASLLYILNLFFFVSHPNYNIHLTFILMPLLFILIHRIVEHNNKVVLFLVVIISFLIPSAFINPPAVIPTFFIGSLYFVYLTLKEKAYQKPSRLGFTIAFAVILFLLLNIWWIYPFIYTTYFNSILTVLDKVVFNIFRTTSLHEVLRFSGGWAFNKYYLEVNNGRYDDFYQTNNFFIFCTYLVIFFSFLSMFYIKKNKNIIFFLFLALIGITLAKGDLEPFGFLYLFIWRHIPGMFIFREPYTKFMLLYVFSASILLGYFILYFRHQTPKITKFIRWIIFFAIIIPSVPFFIGGFIPRFHAGPLKSYLIKIPSYVAEFGRYDRPKKLDYRILSSPKITAKGYLWESGFNIDDTVLKYFSKKPTLSYGNRSLFAPNANNLMISVYNALDNREDHFINLAGLLTVGEVVQENDTDWRWGDKVKTQTQMEDIFNYFNDKNFLYPIKQFGLFDEAYLSKIPNNIPDFWPQGVKLDLSKKEALRKIIYEELLNKPATVVYKINKEYFIPHIYIPGEVIPFATSSAALSQILSKKQYKPSTAFYFTSQNLGKGDIIKQISEKKQNEEKPVLEFKKISSTKYRVIVHNAVKKFPLIFSEAYNENWKIYSVSSTQLSNISPSSRETILKNYKILDGNSEDQASLDEIISFINNNLITTFGDLKQKEINHLTFDERMETIHYKENYTIDFISKNFQNTIQNDNLPDGNIAETWLINKSKLEIPHHNHLTANGFANSWLINPSEICSNSSICKRNTDGTYEIELVIEFGLQQYFIWGTWVSLLTLGCCLVYLIVNQALQLKKNRLV